MTNKKFKTITYFFVILLICFLAAPSFFTSSFLTKLINNNNEVNVVEKSLYPSVFDLNDEDKTWIEYHLEQMDLRAKVGQMVTVLIPPNTSISKSSNYEKAISYVKDLKVGGIIFSRNDIQDQVLLTNKLQEISSLPLIVSADFENGLGMRLNDATEFPYNMALAAAGDINLVYKMGKQISEEVKAIGVHQNYAPIADINNNYLNPIINVRSFSEDKEIVSRYISAFILGSKQHKILTTVKHFPGHGNTNIDSHLDLPKLNIDLYNLANNELVPFMQAIRTGVHSVMIGHIQIPAIESGRDIPATLSYRIVTDLLQGELGFDGLIVTDAMNMNAITKYYSVEEAAVMAVLAGNDIVLMTPNPEAAINAIIQAVEDGKISYERIDLSVRKILSAKKWLQLDINKSVDIKKAIDLVKKKKSYLLANELAEKSITLVKDNNNLIPVDPSKIYKTACISVTNGISAGFLFENLLIDNFGYVNKIVINSRSRESDYKKALQIARNSDFIIIPSFIRVKTENQARKNSERNFDLINKILEMDKPKIFLSFGDPYLLTYFPQAETYLCSYGNTQVSQRAMMNAILGKISIQGTLPVSIPETEYSLGGGSKVEQKVLDLNPHEKGYYDFSSLDIAMLKGIEEKTFPGGVLLIGKQGKVIYHKPFGKFTYEPSSTIMTENALFDLSSLTQFAATNTAAMLLYDEGKLKLNEKVSYYLPDFGNNGKENISVKDLLVNHSDLNSINANINDDRNSFIKSIMNLNKQEFNSKRHLNMIALQLIIEKESRQSLDTYLKEKLFEPLNLEKTQYNPPKVLWYHTPPTSDIYSSEKRNKGVVYDTAAFIMNGIAGHSGLFSTAKELAVFAQLLLQNGKYHNKQWIKTSTIEEWIRFYDSDQANSPGNQFLLSGETGTSLLINKKDEMFVILLTNSIYPGGHKNKINSFRNSLYKHIYESIEY